MIDINFQIDGTTLVKYRGNSSNVVVPAGIHTISKNAFGGNKSIRSVVFPSSINEIGENAFFQCAALQDVKFEGLAVSIEKQAFAFCSSLKKINLPMML